MRWLITTPVDADLDDLRAELSALDGRLSDEPPIPLDDDEHVIGAEGPRDLPSKLASTDVPVTKVSPDSEFELY